MKKKKKKEHLKSDTQGMYVKEEDHNSTPVANESDGGEYTFVDWGYLGVKGM